jgi:DUF4097 and DUF4098 domain-containing protein YvlB
MKEERKKILEMVKTGQISVDEAEKLLADLDHIEAVIAEKEANVAKELSTIQAYESENNQSNTEHDQQTGSAKASLFAKEVKETLFNLFDGAMKKLKDMDLDFYHSVKVTHVFQQNANEFQDMFIEIPNGSVQLMVWNHTDVRVECEGKVYREEDPVAGKERFLKNIELVADEQSFTFLSKEKFMKVDTKIYLPEKEYNKIYVKLFNGSISGESVKGKKLDLQSSNGQIRLTGCEAEKGDLETVNGTITITQCTIEDVEVETMNGKLTIDGIYKKMDLETISGSISAYIGYPVPESAKLSSGTGSIHVRLAKDLPVSGEVKSNFGNAKVNLEHLYKIDEKKELIQKVVQFDTTAELQNKMYLFAESKTGSVDVEAF